MSILEIKDVTYGYTKLEHVLFEVNQSFECGSKGICQRSAGGCGRKSVYR